MPHVFMDTELFVIKIEHRDISVKNNYCSCNYSFLRKLGN